MADYGTDWVIPGARCRYQGRLGQIVRRARIAHREAWVKLDDDDHGPYSLRIEDLTPVLEDLAT